MPSNRAKTDRAAPCPEPIQTRYGQTAAVETIDGGVKLLVGPSASMDGRALHLNEAQARELAARLPADEPGEVIFDTTDRGFHMMPPVATQSGVALRVQESSAASGPHVWVFQDFPTKVEMAEELGEIELLGRDASQLRAHLEAWLADIPNRWDLSEDNDEDEDELWRGLLE